MTSTISYDVEVGTSWTKIDVACDGNTWNIQPVSGDVRYLVLEDTPTTEEGGVIEKGDQLMFAKVSGDLYLKDADGQGKVAVYVNKQETAE